MLSLKTNVPALVSFIAVIAAAEPVEASRSAESGIINTIGQSDIQVGQVVFTIPTSYISTYNNSSDRVQAAFWISIKWPEMTPFPHETYNRHDYWNLVRVFVEYNPGRLDTRQIWRTYEEWIDENTRRKIGKDLYEYQRIGPDLGRDYYSLDINYERTLILCDKNKQHTTNPRCTLPDEYSRDVRIYIHFSKIHLSDAAVLRRTVRCFLLNAAGNKNDHQRECQ